MGTRRSQRLSETVATPVDNDVDATKRWRYLQLSRLNVDFDRVSEYVPDRRRLGPWSQVLADLEGSGLDAAEMCEIAMREADRLGIAERVDRFVTTQLATNAKYQRKA